MDTLKNLLTYIEEEKETKILPENIKKNVKIFDITGTYEGSGGSGGYLTETLTGESLEFNNTVNAKFNTFRLGGNTIVENDEIKNAGSIINPNLFDKYNINKLKGYFHSGSTVISSNENRVVIYIPCEANTTYTVHTIQTFSAANQFSVGYATTQPAIGTQIYNIVSDSNNIKTITTGSNAQYLVAYIYNNNTSFYTHPYGEILNGLKIEEGSQATPYTPFNAYVTLTVNINDEENLNNQTIDFPILGGQILHETDYLDNDGIHQNHKTITVASGESSVTIGDMKPDGTIYSTASGTLSGITFTFNNTLTEEATIEYELDTEEITSYTTEQELAYLRLQNLKSYEGTTYVSSSDTVGPVFTVEAYKYNEDISL